MRGSARLATEIETKTRDDAAEQDERAEGQRDEQRERGGEDSQPGGRKVAGVVLRGAGVGGLAGMAIGAWVAFAKAMWPEQIAQAARETSETVRDVGGTAGRAAAQSIDPAAVAGLLPGNGDRSEVVRRTARDAATAAAKAAREAIATRSEGANAPKRARNRKEGD